MGYGRGPCGAYPASTTATTCPIVLSLPLRLSGSFPSPKRGLRPTGRTPRFVGAVSGPTERCGRPQYGQVAVSALGSGRACPATVIAFCPSCQLVVRPLGVRRTDVHPSTLPPLAALAVRALLG